MDEPDIVAGLIDSKVRLPLPRLSLCSKDGAGAPETARPCGIDAVAVCPVGRCAEGTSS